MSAVVARMPEPAAPDRRLPAERMQSFLSWGTLRATCVHPRRSLKLTWQTYPGRKSYDRCCSSDNSCDDNDSVSSDSVAARQQFRHINLRRCAFLPIQRHQRQDNCFGTSLLFHLHEYWLHLPTPPQQLHPSSPAIKRIACSRLIPLFQRLP